MPEQTSVVERSRLRSWIIEHDDKWLFVILYIGLAVVLSIWISLFWLVFVVAIHFMLEIVRQQHLRTQPAQVLAEALWEVKLDITLVIFAMALSLYMDMLFEMVTLGLSARLAALLRAGRLGKLLQGAAKAGARFAGWQRLIRGFFLSVDDIAQVVRALGKRSVKTHSALSLADNSQPIKIEMDKHSNKPSNSSWLSAWSWGDALTIGLGLACTVLILASPWLTNHTFNSAFLSLIAELQPFP
jgi:hypothetical protein